MDETIFEEVREIAARMTGVKKERITPETTIENGLRIIGDDVAELLEAIAVRYQLDVSEIPFDKYFDPEAGCMYFLVAAIGRKIRGEKLEPKPHVTMRDLVEWVEAGKWVLD